MFWYMVGFPMKSHAHTPAPHTASLQRHLLPEALYGQKAKQLCISKPNAMAGVTQHREILVACVSTAASHAALLHMQRARRSCSQRIAGHAAAVTGGMCSHAWQAFAATHGPLPVNTAHYLASQQEAAAVRERQQPANDSPALCPIC